KLAPAAIQLKWGSAPAPASAKPPAYAARQSAASSRRRPAQPGSGAAEHALVDGFCAWAREAIRLSGQPKVRREGAPNGSRGGLGTGFQMTLAGTLTTVVSFSDTVPPSSLMRARDGNFYGTMSGGGRYTCVTLKFGQFCDYFGTIFKLSPDGTMTNLVLFNVS